VGEASAIVAEFELMGLAGAAVKEPTPALARRMQNGCADTPG
jgi:hypothetical protein